MTHALLKNRTNKANSITTYLEIQRRNKTWVTKEEDMFLTVAPYGVVGGVRNPKVPDSIYAMVGNQVDVKVSSY